jgi:hypothetical protein
MMSKFSELDIERQNAATEGLPIMKALTTAEANTHIAMVHWTAESYPTDDEAAKEISLRSLDIWFRTDGTADMAVWKGGKMMAGEIHFSKVKAKQLRAMLLTE